VCSVQKELKKLGPGLSYSPKLPTSVPLSILILECRREWTREGHA